MPTLLPCEVRECARAGVQRASVNWYSCIMPWHFVGCSTHTHTKSTSISIDATHIPVTGPRPPTDPCWRIQHTRWSIENSWQLSLAFEWNRAPCRVSHPAFLISMLHTHPHTRTHWRPRTHASCRDSLRFWLRLRLCDMKYSCNRRHQNVFLQRAFNCISSAGREESKSKSKYFRYVFGCAPPRHDIAIFFFFSPLFFCLQTGCG